MSIEIKELYKIKEKDHAKLYELLLAAFASYPKFKFTFPDINKRLAAIEMSIRFYCTYDLVYGSGFSLDENINESVVMIHSDYMDYPDELTEKAGCCGEDFQKAAERLSPEEQDIWWAFFDEFDRLEAKLDLKRPYYYLDFVAVKPELQGQGRGSKLISTVCRYADEQGLPVMLFTNDERDITFYERNGFRIIGQTTSEKYGFNNTYMWYENR